MVKSEDLRCAPSKKFINGSCISHENLITIGEKINQNQNRQINLNLNKNKLVNSIAKNLSKSCSSQRCWLTLDVVKSIDNPKVKNDLLYHTYLPTGPTKKYDWLSTTHINEKLNQYHKVYPEFLFLGAVPIDFDKLPILGIKDIKWQEIGKKKWKIGIVFNLDEHNMPGSHWVSVYIDLRKGLVYFFDSQGSKPEKRIKIFMNRLFKHSYKLKFGEELPLKFIYNSRDRKSLTSKHHMNIKNMELKYNKIQHQFKNSECGVYSIHFILKLLDGNSFDHVCDNIVTDDEMNKNRLKYFL